MPPDVHEDLEHLCDSRNQLSHGLYIWNQAHSERQRMHDYEQRLLWCDHAKCPPYARLKWHHHPLNPLGLWGLGDTERMLAPFHGS